MDLAQAWTPAAGCSCPSACRRGGGKGGLTLAGLHQADGWAQGPVTLWGRFSPPLLSWMDDTAHGAALALQVEYAAGHPPFDRRGTLFPDSHTYLAVAQGQLAFLRGSFSAGLQLAHAQDGSIAYRGAQVTGATSLQLDGPGIQAGAELLYRTGQEVAGSWRSEWTVALSFRVYDVDGHQVQGGYQTGSRGTSILAGYGISCGPSYVATGCRSPRSLWQQAQDAIARYIEERRRLRAALDQVAGQLAGQLAPHPSPPGSPEAFP